MAFQQGLSGLNSSSKALDAISNNIANASTVGYKAAGVQFADVYAASLGVGGASPIGIGTSIAAVQQQFSQGNISTSNNPLDMAINGSGFFQLQKSPTDLTKTYSRNGQFHVDDEGYVVNAQSYNLRGYQYENGTLSQTLAPIQLSSRGVDPQATGAAGLNPGVQVEVNLDDRELKSLGSPSPNTLGPWTDNSVMPPDNLNTYNYSTAITIYDQRGNDHSLSMYFTRVDDSSSGPPDKNLWEVHYVLDDQDITSIVTASNNGAAVAGDVPTLEFQEGGGIETTGWTASATRAVDYQFNIAAADLETFVDGSGGTPFAQMFPSDIPISFANSTLFGAGYDVNRLVQDGYPYGRLSGISVSPDGVVQGNYSNGQTSNIAKVALFDFTSPTGLASLGNNQWAETSASGQALPGVPGVGSRGLLQASAVEDSNVDLTQELVNMITQQRNYQANAQSIKTQDQVMQTLVNLR